MRLILLNGPPRSGKDTAATAIIGANIPYFGRQAPVRFGMAQHLKEATHALYGHPDRRFDYYEETKDIPNADFFGLTPRQAYIAVSEKLMKPLHGEDVFGRIYVRRIKTLFATCIIAPDAGFAAEWNPVIAEYGAENLLLIQVYADKRGKTFKGDSRSYIHLPGVETRAVTNDGEPGPFCAEVVRIVKDWLGRE